MKNLKSHFAFTRSQQNGIFVLVAVIILLQLVYFFFPVSSEATQDRKTEELVEQMQRSVDSLKEVAKLGDTAALRPFNPNFISDHKGYLLGMSVEEIDRLHDFRSRDLWINSAEEFQKVTGISDSLLRKISPAFQFPDFRRNTSGENKVSKRAFSAPLPKADLNTATAEDLRKVNGIGEKLSGRIINYRNVLGNFRGEAQLRDVYGLSPEVIERVLQRFEVKEPSKERLDINTATVMQLVELPYFNYEQARAIVKYREEAGEITNFEDLQQIKNFPVEKLDRINLYLTIDQKN
ncbi:ComEA family DNA-binding protein [Salinimicrobium oceani]|uniref:Helix-hairpin-helix domain-containing protein n=1 Tax=Salinimicrobium oceani TaxID=2722702 RepID=A0ABX1CXT1_9FLAO|nr:helix-hairpin-helix domain-containing protein [Salinimicrobium oceani]NJW51759.1 helix-hairpin-helix domain-containing protein [Salinimicrobium oceani]